MQDSKQIIIGFYDALNAGQMPPSAPAGFVPGLTELLKAFPDIRYTLTHVVADGDQVAVRWSWTGTHRGTFRGVVPATGATVTNTGMAIFVVAGGAIASAVLETDRLGFLEAVGATAKVIDTAK